MFSGTFDYKPLIKPYIVEPYCSLLLPASVAKIVIVLILFSELEVFMANSFCFEEDACCRWEQRSEMVYRYGLREELMGRMKTTIQA